ncbi:MAG TPA: 2-amino-4-hydroxy-6-hydroxymethyldihydropteridine diphosphokinase [Spirochaetota bacterium]|nr:2-amino-4-hydroxy-6-hydroxymethyldihydropteridine diphosphokinase [Spirochaetota bacterium]HOM37964.1 2-amino-4-hydroxy-6-hydroxymethyldihydropteridine diphosphokinase [Spirochaetota bacterium]HPQ48769.1 2-amino-4-hydroxy-6-hydroxymethyldihydropteridine diphosphokinase [Spirochaetota bacterium]
MNYRILFLGIGSNLGDRKKNIKDAIKILSEYFNLKRIAPFYETEPIGPSQPFFINTVVKCETNMNPYQVLEKVKEIEKNMGREENIRWGPRIIDIDVLFMEGVNINDSRLFIPHKEIKNRRFFLEPLFYLGVNIILDGKSILYYLNKSLGQICEKI